MTYFLLSSASSAKRVFTPNGLAGYCIGRTSLEQENAERNILLDLSSTKDRVHGPLNILLEMLNFIQQLTARLLEVYVDITQARSTAKVWLHGYLCKSPNSVQVKFVDRDCGAIHVSDIRQVVGEDKDPVVKWFEWDWDTELVCASAVLKMGYKHILMGVKFLESDIKFLTNI